MKTWPVLLAAAIGVAILTALGFWQLQRLEWKSARIAEIEMRRAVGPVTLKEASARTDTDYLRVSASGRFRLADERYMLASSDGGPGFIVVTPFVTTDNYLILVDRGIVNEAFKDPAKRPETEKEIVITGQLLRHAVERNIFVPDNDEAANVWYWWDVPALLGSIEVPRDLAVLPFVLHLEPASDAPQWPKPQALGANLRNNHLGYALTWFGLALALAAIAATFIMQRRRMRRA